jgi:AhpD family alkylhydroperoxidase
MEARFDYQATPTGARFLRHMVMASQGLGGSTLPAATQELVKIRVSQINGCAFCVDMHTKEAALALAEEGTRVADAAGGVPDEVWAAAAKHYDEDQLAALVSLIALMNTFNRMNVIVRQPAGDYVPGQHG